MNPSIQVKDLDYTIILIAIKKKIFNTRMVVSLLLVKKERKPRKGSLRDKKALENLNPNQK
jgi:hypothetical protein